MQIDIEAERKMFSDDFRKRLSPTYNNASDEYVTVILCKPEFEAWLRRAALAAPQQEPVAWVRLRDGTIDWAEDCLYPHPSDHDGYEGEDGVVCVPVFIGAPPPVPPMPTARQDRFFIDHGLWHDRVTGQHMYTQDQYDEESRACLAEGKLNALISPPAAPVLSDEEIIQIAKKCWMNEDDKDSIAFAREIESALLAKVAK